MPELPEVETITRDLQTAINGLIVKDIEVFDSRVIKDLTPKVFRAKLTNQKIQDIQRRAKAIIISFESGVHMVVQVRMTGQLIYGQQEILKETKVRFQLCNGEYLNYNDQRLFGWLIFAKDLKQVSYLTSVGPEPLLDEFNPHWLKKSLKKRVSPIKPLLMNQDFVAGIGNIYASEILFKAAVRPTRKANRLKNKEIESLYKATVDILTKAIEHRGCSMRNYRDSFGKKGSFMNYIKVYAREGDSCMICKNPIKKIVQAGRSTFYCQRCQQ